MIACFPTTLRSLRCGTAPLGPRLRPLFWHGEFGGIRRVETGIGMRPQLFEACQLFSICPENAIIPERRPPAMDPSVTYPPAELVTCCLQVPREVTKPPFIRAQLRRLVPATAQFPAREELPYHPLVERPVRMDGMEPLVVQALGDLCRSIACLAQLTQSVDEAVEVSQLAVASNRAANLMLTDEAACPAQRHIDELTLALDA